MSRRSHLSRLLDASQHGLLRRIVVGCVIVALALIGSAVGAPAARAISDGTTATVIRGEVQFEVNGVYRCGGTLISPTWVLTAKHCITDGEPASPDNTTLRVGSLHRGQGFSRGAAQFVLHPTVDAALIRLSSPVPRSLTMPFATGVAGRPTGPDPHPTLTVSGW